MNQPRTVMLGAACGAVAVWLAAASTSNTSSSSQNPPQTIAPIEARGAALAEEVARLRERLRPTAAPLHTRDLFHYRGPSGRGTQPSNAAPVSAAVPALDAAVPAAAPALALVGLAEDAGPDGPIRTAIISGAGDLFLVKVGDPVTDRYRVAAISAGVVELTDVAAGTALRLALK
jgi:hypothetical protein